jgi:hypothetical protein
MQLPSHRAGAGAALAAAVTWLVWTGTTTTRAGDAAGFHFAPVNEASLGLWEGSRPVFVYNHGVIRREGVPADRARSTYLHPVHGLDGEVLTDDFPRDHYHHRGLFWAWPHVKVGAEPTDLWMLKGVRQQFERWLARDADPAGAVLGVENGWYVGDRQVMQEQAWFRVHPATATERAIDVEFRWVPVGQPITLAGAEGKSYGGLTLRFATNQNTVITTPMGNGKEDLPMTRLPWADLSGGFANGPAGAAIFIAPNHPDFPPMWLTRHYGVLCVGWPGIEPRTIAPGEAIRAAYRVWIHRGLASGADLERAFGAYRDQVASAPSLIPSTAAPPAPRPAQTLQAELRADRLVVRVGEAPFTEYLLGPETKYPYFHPVIGPRSGKTVTVDKTEPYPHHSSIFFGCDRVNGGNYWQEGLDRGRIVSKGLRLVRDRGERIEFEQDCVWERPGAEAPFDDHRRVGISAPEPGVRFIDFDVRLTARIPVKIEKTNHSLFSVRVAPDLAVTGGGTLLNAHGHRGEKATFNQPAPWAVFGGPRAGGAESVAILSHPQNRWFPEPWFTRDYGFLSPTPLNWLPAEGLQFAAGESLHLRYRVVVVADEPTTPRLQAWFEDWAAH